MCDFHIVYHLLIVFLAVLGHLVKDGFLLTESIIEPLSLVPALVFTFPGILSIIVVWFREKLLPLSVILEHISESPERVLFTTPPS